MSTATARRTGMVLYSEADEMDCHQVRIVLAEKGIAYELVEIKAGQVPEDVHEVNPYGTLPTLVDRDVAVFQANLINDYLDERFPHPALMPVYPAARANNRLLRYRIERDWYALARAILTGASTSQAARRDLREGLLAMAPLFQENTYFLSEEFSLVDCCLAALLWRLPKLGIELSGAGSKAVLAYMGRVFERDAFQLSLTAKERERTRG